jgi:hypothetical protein
MAEQALTPIGIEKRPVVMRSMSITTAIKPMIFILDILNIYLSMKLYPIKKYIVGATCQITLMLTQSIFSDVINPNCIVQR